MDLFEQVARALERIASSSRPGILFEPIAKGEVVIEDDISGKDLQIHRDVCKLHDDIAEKAQDLYVMMDKISGMKSILWSNLKMNYPSIRKADMSGKAIAMRKDKDGRVVIVSISNSGPNIIAPNMPPELAQIFGIPMGSSDDDDSDRKREVLPDDIEVPDTVEGLREFLSEDEEEKDEDE